MTRWTKEQYDEYMATLRPPAPLSSALGIEIADPGKESKLQAKIIKWAKDHGFPVFHDRSKKKNEPGWPDITLCLPQGVVLFIELKSVKGIMHASQKRVRQQMVFLGHNHYIVRSYKRFLEIVSWAIMKEGE